MGLYEKLAERLEDQIRAGKLPVGQRLPSVRELSSQESVSPSTVVEAYALLMERGWVESRVRSGFFVSGKSVPTPQPESNARPALLRENYTLAPEELVLALRQAAHDPKILPFGAATPAPSFFPYRAISRSLARTLREEPALSGEYTFPPGSLALRKAVAARYRRFGVKCDPEDIVTTAGATEAIALSLRAIAKPGETILVESPTYFGILQTLQALGYRVLEVPVHPRNGLEPERLEAALRRVGGRVRGAILVPNHSNPLGARIPDPAKEAIVRIAARNDMTIIEDDVYGDLSHDQSRPRPLKAFDGSDRVVLCSSFSKTVAPGLRVGFAISNRFARQLIYQRGALVCGTAIVAEETLASYLSDGRFDRQARRVSKEYSTLVSRFSMAVRESFPPGTRISQPQGGYVLWLQLPGGIDSRMIQRRALAEKISVASGSMFSAQGAYRDCMRLCCALPWGPSIERGIARLGRVVADAL